MFSVTQVAKGLGRGWFGMSDNPDDPGNERTVNGDVVVQRENRHGVETDYVRVAVSETKTVEVPRQITNPLTGRRHDLTTLSDDGYLKPFLALNAAYNTPDVVDLSSSPVLTFDKDRWDVEDREDLVVLKKREVETEFDEIVMTGE